MHVLRETTKGNNDSVCHELLVVLCAKNTLVIMFYNSLQYIYFIYTGLSDNKINGFLVFFSIIFILHILNMRLAKVSVSSKKYITWIYNVFTNQSSFEPVQTQCTK